MLRHTCYILFFILLSSVCYARTAEDSRRLTNRLSLTLNNFQPNTPKLYEALRSLHQEAVEKRIQLIYPHDDVNHSGKVIKLTISDNMLDKNRHLPFIPLPEYTDFNGWTYEVNLISDVSTYLFHFSESTTKQIQGISKKAIDIGCFQGVRELNNGLKLLIIQDKAPWTYRNETPDTYFPDGRPGTPWQKWNHHDPKYRSDILLLENGVAQNSVIASYQTKTSTPSCFYANVSSRKKEIKHLCLHRTGTKGGILKLLHISNTNNMELSDITVFTEPAILTGDACISIVNSSNIKVKNYTIEDTYSSTTVYGYGLDMNNVWNVHFIKMRASGPTWGVFGNNNINTAKLDNCTINRFDLHMYGKDITCSHCTFRNDNYKKEVIHAKSLDHFQEKNTHIYNRYVSLYGTLTYDHCHFDGFIPFRTDYGYNIFTGCNVEFKNCTMDIYQKKYAYLFLMGYWGAPANERLENAMRSWHNILIDSMDIRLHADIPNVYLYYFMDRELQRAPIQNRLINNKLLLKLNHFRMMDSLGRPSNSVSFKETNINI